MGMGKPSGWNVHLPGRHRKGNVEIISRLTLFSFKHSSNNTVGGVMRMLKVDNRDTVKTRL